MCKCEKSQMIIGQKCEIWLRRYTSESALALTTGLTDLHSRRIRFLLCSNAPLITRTKPSVSTSTSIDIDLTVNTYETEFYTRFTEFWKVQFSPEIFQINCSEMRIVTKVLSSLVPIEHCSYNIVEGLAYNIWWERRQMVTCELYS